jgi:superfamily I DNA and/or RNA helicase
MAQGGEREVIILSCVRTNSQSGFVDSERRVNVAISRAQRYSIALTEHLPARPPA